MHSLLTSVFGQLLLIIAVFISSRPGSQLRSLLFCCLPETPAEHPNQTPSASSPQRLAQTHANRRTYTAPPTSDAAPTLGFSVRTQIDEQQQSYERGGLASLQGGQGSRRAALRKEGSTENHRDIHSRLEMPLESPPPPPGQPGWRLWRASPIVKVPTTTEAQHTHLCPAQVSSKEVEGRKS